MRREILMEAILISDLHLIDRPIFSRKDDTYQTQFEKLKFIFDYAKKNDIEYIFQAGDMFDKPRSYRLLEDFMELLSKYSFSVYCVSGQHDMLFRNIKNTNMSILNKTGYLKILNDQPVFIDSVFIYGQSWNQKDIPKVNDKTQKNLLVAHSPIALEKNYHGHNLVDFQKLKDFRFVLCGDIHKEFFKDNILNTGPMLRKDITLKKHNPCFYVLDWIEKKPNVKRIEIPFISDVFEEKIELQGFDKQGFDDFIEEIQMKNETSFGFYDILKISIENEPKEIQEIIYELEKE